PRGGRTPPTSRQTPSTPNPPKVARTKSRTSRPRRTVTWRRALAWFQAAISSTPAATAGRSSPSLGPSASRPAAARGGGAPRRGAVGWDPPQDQVGVGHRGLGAAAAVAHRARVGPGRARPHLEPPPRGQPGPHPPPA